MDKRLTGTSRKKFGDKGLVEIATEWTFLELIAVFDIFEVSWYFAVPVGRGDWTEDLWVFVPKSGGLLEGEQEDLTSGDKVKFGSLQGILG